MVPIANESLQYFDDRDYFHIPNILWSRSIAIAPENSKNNTEIIFTRPYPRAIVRERVNRYFQLIRRIRT